MALLGRIDVEDILCHCLGYLKTIRICTVCEVLTTVLLIAQQEALHYINRAKTHDAFRREHECWKI